MKELDGKTNFAIEAHMARVTWFADALRRSMPGCRVVVDGSTLIVIDNVLVPGREIGRLVVGW